MNTTLATYDQAVTLYFSKKQIQSLSIDQQSRVLNDLDEKIHKATELMLERPSLQKVMDKVDLTASESEQYTFSYYILTICSMHTLCIKGM